MSNLQTHDATLANSLNVGTGITPSTDNGDLVVGDGTRALFWDASANNLAVGPAAVEETRLSWEGATGRLRITTRDALTTDINGGINSSHRTTGTPAAGFGSRYAWDMDNTVNANIGAFTAECRWSSPTAGAETADMHFRGYQTGTPHTDFLMLRGADLAVIHYGPALWDTDNTLDIGASGATRPRTAYLGTALNIGDGITPSTANGDLVAGDGTNALSWDASATTLTVTDGTNPLSITNSSIVQNSAQTLTIGTQSGASSVDVVCGTAGINIGTNATNHIVTIGSTTSNSSVQLNAAATGTGVTLSTAAPINLNSADVALNSANPTMHSADAAASYTFTIRAGNHTGTGTGGALALVSGNGGATSGNAGNLTIDSGTVTSGTTGTITIGGTNASTIAFGDTQITGPRSVLATVTGINAKTVAATNLYTVPTGKTAIIEKVIVRVTAATAASGDAVAGVGIAAGESDIVAAQTLTGVTTVDDAFVLAPSSGLFRIADAAEIVKLGIDTGDTGTAVTWDVDVIGYIF